MNLLTSIISERWLNLAPTLLHTLWLATLVALALGLALFLIPASQPRLRYGLSIASLVVDRETGWPIPGVEVYALPTSDIVERGGHIDADAKTDGNGRFRFTTMDDGEYLLGVRSGSMPPRHKVKVTGDKTPPVTIPMTLTDWSKLKPVKPEPGRSAAAR